jgi:hypothetical protein
MMIGTAGSGGGWKPSATAAPPLKPDRPLQVGEIARRDAARLPPAGERRRVDHGHRERAAPRIASGEDEIEYCRARIGGRAER